jgi:cytochrome c5
MDQNCNVCHATGSTAGGGIVLDTHAGTSSVAQSGRLIGAVRHESGYSAMPKNGNQLDDCSILKLEIWVSEGSPDN